MESATTGPIVGSRPTVVIVLPAPSDSPSTATRLPSIDLVVVLTPWTRVSDVTGGRRSRKVVERFDREWDAFREVGTADHSEMFGQYFDLIPESELHGANVLDAGSGAGRWAVQVALRGGHVTAVDIGESVYLAIENGRRYGVRGVRADITALPFDDGSFDFVYSLGVLHHLEEPERGMAELVRVLRPGGRCLVYVYYALDGRGPVFRAIFRAVDFLRQLLSVAPQPLLTFASTLIAALVYFPLARTSLIAQAVGLTGIARAMPLSFYARRSFRIMRNDSLDRFGTRIEKRFTRQQFLALIRDAGLANIVISDGPPYWHAVGLKPLARPD